MIPKDPQRRFKRKLYSELRRRGLSLKALAADCGYEYGTCWRWVDGNRRPPPGFQELIERHLGLPRGELSVEVQR